MVNPLFFWWLGQSTHVKPGMRDPEAVDHCGYTNHHCYANVVYPISSPKRDRQTKTKSKTVIRRAVLVYILLIISYRTNKGYSHVIFQEILTFPQPSSGNWWHLIPSIPGIPETSGSPQDCFQESLTNRIPHKFSMC